MTFLALHITNTKDVPLIKKEGLDCKIYPDHPIAKGFDCPTFFYPLDGIDEHLKFLPQNARMKNEDVNDTSYLVMDIPNCVVGDLTLEDQTELYKQRATQLKKYKNEQLRNQFREPEIICHHTTSKDLILGSLLFTELNAIHDKCKLTGNVSKCMETEIRQHISNGD